MLRFPPYSEAFYKRSPEEQREIEEKIKKIIWGIKGYVSQNLSGELCKPNL